MMKASEALERGIAPDTMILAVNGQEAFLREQVIERFITQMPPDVEVVALNPDDGIELSDLFDDLRMRGLFGGDKLIHLKNADAFVKEHSDALQRFMEQGEAVQRLVIESKEVMGKNRKTLPKTGFMAAVAKAGGVVVACDALYDSPFKGRGPAWQSPLSRWVVERASSYGKRLSMEDAYTLHRMIGNKLRELDAEIKKLATFVKDAPRITGDDVQRCVGEGRLAPVFDLAEAVAARKLSESLDMAGMLFERGMLDYSGRFVRDHASISMVMVAAIGRTIRKVARVQEMMADGDSFEEAASAVKQNAFFRDQLRAQVEAWRDRAALRKAMSEFVELERGLKSGGGKPRLLVDRFLVTALAIKRPVAAAAGGGGGRSWRRR